MSCGEQITVRVSGGGEEDYESLVIKAMHRVSEFLPGAAIKRRDDECDGGDREEWFLACGHSEVSAGGNALAGAFTFLKHGSSGLE